MKAQYVVYILLFLVVSCRRDADPNPNLKRGLIPDQTITIAGVDREYSLFVPEDYIDAPVVMLFHGHSGNHHEIIESTPYKAWLDLAHQENILVVIPNGLYTSDIEKGWNDCRADALTNSPADDVLFIHTLLDRVLSEYAADAKRIYINGTSNGGHFCIRLAMEMPERLAAFATVVASHAVQTECANSSVPVSALFMNGTDDPFMPYAGGQMINNRGEVFSTDDAIQYWVNRNGTNATPNVEALMDLNTSDNCTVEKQLYTNGLDNTEVALYKIVGGGHTEPSQEVRYGPPLVPFILGHQNGDMEMAEEVWRFFQDKSK